MTVLTWGNPLGMGQFRQVELFTLMFITFPQTSAAIHVQATVFKE